MVFQVETLLCGGQNPAKPQRAPASGASGLRQKSKGAPLQGAGMTTPYLTDAEIVDLCAPLVQPAAQARALKALGVAGQAEAKRPPTGGPLRIRPRHERTATHPADAGSVARGRYPNSRRNRSSSLGAQPQGGERRTANVRMVTRSAWPAHPPQSEAPRRARACLDWGHLRPGDSRAAVQAKGRMLGPPC